MIEIRYETNAIEVISSTLFILTGVVGGSCTGSVGINVESSWNSGRAENVRRQELNGATNHSEHVIPNLQSTSQLDSEMLRSDKANGKSEQTKCICE